MCRNRAFAVLQGSSKASQTDRSKLQKKERGCQGSTATAKRGNVFYVRILSHTSANDNWTNGTTPYFSTPQIPRPKKASRDSKRTATQRCSCDGHRAGVTVRHYSKISNVSRIPANQVVPQGGMQQILLILRLVPLV